MSPAARRIVVPLIVTGIAAGVVLSVVFSRPPAGSSQPVTPEQAAAATPGGETPVDGQDEAPQTNDTSEPTAADPSPTEGEDDASAVDSGTEAGSRTGTDSDAGDAARPRGDLRVVAPPSSDSTLSIGSLDPREAPMLLEFSLTGAGIEKITLSDQWVTARTRRQAEAHYAALDAGDQNPPPLPSETMRYVLGHAEPLWSTDVPIMAVYSIEVNGKETLLLYGPGDDGLPKDVWSATAPGVFRTQVHDDDGPILEITRSFELSTEGDIVLRQSVRNLLASRLQIRWNQFGPGDLPLDRSRYMDRRRFRFGYLLSPERDPTRQLVLAGKDTLQERQSVLKHDDEGLWPNDDSRKHGYVLSWFASTNRYFALAIHPLLDAQGGGDRALDGVVSSIGHVQSGGKGDERIFTQIRSPVRTLEPMDETSFDMGVYAGPLERSQLTGRQPYSALNMRLLILYQMSSWCAICTFQWLAGWLLGFLSLVHGLLGDWGVAIILLVCVVRALLHPLTKRAQINMQRFSKKMTDLKPELDRLQQKYKNEPKKYQSEQLRMMREHGVNPFQMLGCLPMFLQMPIWVALYAMLYFAFEIRQEPAFWGIFQTISGGHWRFLADLSAADHCFGELREPTQFLMWNITGINLLPFLMGVIFFIQQKYMSPPPSPTMSAEQVQQQKIMKILFVVMFPLMLYSAPSGLTLYILTSSCIGILESRYVRKHIKEMELNPPSPNTKRSKSRDAIGRAYAAALERAEKKRQSRNQPQRSFKNKKRRK